MINNIGNEKVGNLNVLTADISTGINLKVKVGTEGETGTDSTISFVSVGTENARIECDTGSDGFDLKIQGDFELKAFAEAFEFIAAVLKTGLKKGSDLWI